MNEPNPNPNPKNILAQAWFVFEKTKYIRALRLSEQALQHIEAGSETHVNALFLMLKCYLRLQHLRAASNTAAELAQLGVENTELHVELATLARLRQQGENYNKHLAHSIAMSPDNRTLKIEHVLEQAKFPQQRV